MSDTTPLAVGTAAPGFTLPVTGGDTLSLEDLKPNRVVLFFYPKDNTPGCTNEAIDFSTHLAAFEELGVRVLGVSKDSMKKHDNFRAKHELTVDLLSDADGDMCERYGVWVEKKMYGKTYMGIERTTVLIGADGTIEHIWNKVKVPGHVEDVLNTVKT